MNVIMEGDSPLDHKFFFSLYTPEKVDDFVKGIGVDITDPVGHAEMFGNFQESIQFIRRYFLKEENPEGLNLKIPHPFFAITDIRELLMMITKGSKYNMNEQMWAEIILKVMHTILHVDKDLRLNYFPVIQTEIFDRFYKYVHRDQDNRLFLGIDQKE
ncbi:MAG: TIGR04552 family protein, partial [Halobacteriovoraceae bacterium]|nr:TIGR04552 family protein [Halobacteriovoraceae bacterium]